MKAYGYTERPATITSSGGVVNVRSGPGTTYAKVTSLSMGTAVKVINEANASGGELWYQIQFTASDGSAVTGYVLNSFIKFPSQIGNDTDFEAYLTSQGFPESYKTNLRELHAKYPKWVFTAQHTNLDWNTVIEKESVIGKNLVANNSISSWKSTQDGAYNWNTSTWIGFDGASWVMASQDIIRYYMDPRNFLDETFIFTFLTHTYDGVAQTREGVASMVANTFLAGNYNGGSGGSTGGSASPGGSGGPGEVGPGVPSSGNQTPISPNGAGFLLGSAPGGVTAIPGGPGDSTQASTVSPGPGGTASPTSGSSDGPGGPGTTPGGSNSGSGTGSYIDDIMEAGRLSSVNPYVLAAMIIMEQGSAGTSGSISGTTSGYEGYYNFFNVEAYDTGSLTAVQRGLWYASQSGSYGRPWNSIRQSIIGGASFYGQNYTQKGQDTFYLKKFNVQGNNLYNHQYMTNIQGAAGEGSKLAQAYTSDVKNSALEFKIPVYTNMPETPCAKPTGDGNPNNKLSSLSISGFTLTPTFSTDILDYDLIVSESVTSITVNATALDSRASVSGIGTVNLNSGNNTITIAVKAQNGTVRNYTIDIVRGQGSSGNASGPGGSSGPGGNSSPGESTSPGGAVSPGGSNGPGGNSSNGSSGSSGPGGSSSPGGSSGPGGNSSNGGSVSPGPGGTASPGTSSGSYKIDNGVVSGIAADTAVLDFVTAFQNSGTVKVYKPDGSENTGKVGTGDKIQVYNSGGSPTATYTAQVRGDNNGDGTIGIIDLLQVQRHILGISILEGVYLNASDVNGNGELDLLDILMIQRDVLGIEKIK